MEIALKSLAVISVVVLVLLSIGFFMLTQSGSSGASASYDRIFFGKCEEIQQRGCGEGDEWNSIERDADFINACKYIYDQSQNAFSCTYQFCSGCKRYNTAEETACGGWCRGIIAGAALNPDGIQSQCNSNAKCAPSCSACRAA